MQGYEHHPDQCPAVKLRDCERLELAGMCACTVLLRLGMTACVDDRLAPRNSLYLAPHLHTPAQRAISSVDSSVPAMSRTNVSLSPTHTRHHTPVPVYATAAPAPPHPHDVQVYLSFIAPPTLSPGSFKTFTDISLAVSPTNPLTFFPTAPFTANTKPGVTYKASEHACAMLLMLLHCWLQLVPWQALLPPPQMPLPPNPPLQTPPVACVPALLPPYHPKGKQALAFTPCMLRCSLLM